MTRICSISRHVDSKYIHEVYNVDKCIDCGWRIEPQTTTLGLFSMTSPNKCLKTQLRKFGSRKIRNINILPSWCPLPKIENDMELPT